jgi:hypothetical protein
LVKTKTNFISGETAALRQVVGNWSRDFKLGEEFYEHVPDAANHTTREHIDLVHNMIFHDL